MAAHALAVCPSAVGSWYDDVVHMPFWEAAERFDRELGELVDRVDGDAGAARATMAEAT